METVTAEMIKRDFDRASDVIVETLKHTSHDEHSRMRKKAARLKSLGFSKTSEVREYNIMEDALKSIREFSPYRFITEEAVESICKKYGLLFGSSSRYLGEIPEKNLIEIEKFESYQEQKDKKYPKPRDHRSWHEEIHNVPRGVWAPRFETDGFLTRLREVMAPKYHIAAPVNMMEHTADELKEGYKIVDDPIVFKSVPGGYLIITAWGSEAKDPVIFNPSRN